MDDGDGGYPRVNRTLPEIGSKPSDSGDTCHRDISEATKRRANKIFKTHATPYEENLRICVEGKSIPFDPQTRRELVEKARSKQG